MKFYKEFNFQPSYSFDSPTILNKNVKNFQNLKKATKDFIEKCLTLDPAYRPGAAHLLYTDYFSQDEFTKRKPLLQGNLGKISNLSLYWLKKDKFRSTSNLLVQLKIEVIK